MKEEVVYCGVDVAKAYLDAAIGKQKRRLANDATGHRQLINWIKQMAHSNPTQSMLEIKTVTNRYPSCVYISDD